MSCTATWFTFLTGLSFYNIISLPILLTILASLLLVHSGYPAPISYPNRTQMNPNSSQVNNYPVRSLDEEVVPRTPLHYRRLGGQIFLLIWHVYVTSTWQVNALTWSSEC